LLTLAAHALFLLLLVTGGRDPQRQVQPARERVSLPITLFPLPLPPPLEEERPPPDAPPRRVPVPALPRPGTAITLPPVEEEPGSREPVPGDVDWYRQAGELAARVAEELEKPPPTLGKPLQKMREPCKPRESSFKWKDETPGTGGYAVLTPGWEKPPPDSHLFDDMLAGRRSKSSVPDPNECD